MRGSKSEMKKLVSKSKSKPVGLHTINELQEEEQQEEQTVNCSQEVHEQEGDCIPVAFKAAKLNQAIQKVQGDIIFAKFKPNRD